MSSAANACIQANPDISGIGVRIAIYAQNLFSFIPAIVALWDAKVTGIELNAMETQATTILVTAFAILVSAIIEAATTGLNAFHAAIILNLSWMNNTNVFIYFLLYIQHKADRPRDGEDPYSWRFWLNVVRMSLRSPLSEVEHLQTIQADKLEKGRSRDTVRVNSDNTTEGRRIPQKRAFNFGSFTHRLFAGFQEPTRIVSSEGEVLPDKITALVGSIHLSMMAGIGMWLWSRPAHFGHFNISSCPVQPAIVVIQHSVPLTSRGLRIAAIFLYSIVLIPLINVAIPLFLALWGYIWFNRRFRHVKLSQDQADNVPANLAWGVVKFLTFQYIPSHPSAYYRDHNRRVQRGDKIPPTNQPHKIFPLVIGLIALLITNILFIHDTEAMIRRSKDLLEDKSEAAWSFGQTLALLLLLIPLRDIIVEVALKRRKYQFAAINEEVAQEYRRNTEYVEKGKKSSLLSPSCADIEQAFLNACDQGNRNLFLGDIWKMELFRDVNSKD